MGMPLPTQLSDDQSYGASAITAPAALQLDTPVLKEAYAISSTSTNKIPIPSLLAESPKLQSSISFTGSPYIILNNHMVVCITFSKCHRCTCCLIDLKASQVKSHD